MQNRARTAVVALAIAVAAAGCGSDAAPDPEARGARKRAVEVLRDYGLTVEQAGCITDELGAETVVEAGDVVALTEGQAFKDAAEGCIS